MPRKPRKYRTKEAREIAGQIIAAGGIVEINAQGHLVVTGPLGQAVIGSKYDSSGAHDVARGKLAKHAGIIIPRKGCGGGRKAG